MSLALHDEKAALRSYHTEVTDVPPDFRKLLENYSHIAPDNVVTHVNALRGKAWDICQYPCIGQFQFLSLTLLHHPAYSAMLNRLRNGQTFLCMGSCFGQDLRQFVADGVDSTNLYGLEIEEALLSIGYDLFQDRASLKAKFLIGDALGTPEQFSELFGEIDIVNDSAFTHLFPWDQQIRLCTLMARFTRPGALIVGRMTGSLAPGEYPALSPGKTSWRHDVQSLQRLWDQVGLATGTAWKVNATLDLHGIFPVPDGKPKDPKEVPVWWEPNARRLLFLIERLDWPGQQLHEQQSAGNLTQLEPEQRTCYRFLYTCN